MRSSKRGAADSTTGASGHAQTLHRRLLDALSLGTRLDDGNKNELHFSDVEAQRHVLRSISAFLDCLLEDASSRSLVQGALSDIVGALVSIIQCKSEATASMAVNVVFKLTSMRTPILQIYLSHFVHPLSSLLCSCELQVAISCAITLGVILSDLNLKKEKDKEIWEILKERKTIVCIITKIREWHTGRLSIECFQAMASLLGTILWRWPSSRYLVWNDAKLIKMVCDACIEPDFSNKVAVLKLFSALALCSNGAKRLLENKETANMMVRCMNNSESHTVRMEAFKLAQHIAADEWACSKLVSFCCEPLVQAIVTGMTPWSTNSGKVDKDQVSLLAKSCQLALITRWRGGHHAVFWEKGIEKVLLGLLFENFDNKSTQHLLSLEEQISMATEGLDANFLPVLKPYMWEILGWLAVHCGEGLKHHTHENEHHVDILVTCACLAFVKAIRKALQICESDVIGASVNESASRAIFMMMNSPCKLFRSRVRFVLSEVLKRNGGDQYVERMLHFLDFLSSGVNYGLPNILQTVINLAGLYCYSGLSEYQKQVIKCNGIKTLITFVKWCLSNHIHVGRMSFAHHLYVAFHERTCCWAVKEEWEGDDTLLLYSLWALAELIKHCDNMIDLETQVCAILRHVLDSVSASGPRWLAVHILSYFGFYGFPYDLGKSIGKALESEEHADMQLVFKDGESFGVHKVVLAVRCPSLLPPEQYAHREAKSPSSARDDLENLIPISQKEIHLSAHVDKQALLKLLELVYMGYTEVGEELVKKLKPLAKFCSVKPLLQILYKKLPKWGTPSPSHDFSAALGQAGFRYSDVIMESNGTTRAVNWACSFCSVDVPHIHVHRIILWSRCQYFRALFQSGMQESHSQIIKIPVSWDALNKLVLWFYNGKLPSPPSGCLWDTLSFEERLHELQLYIELYSLAEFWVLEDIQSACFKVIASCLDSDGELSVKVIQVAASFSLWNLVEVAADRMAPLYCKLRDSGELEKLDEALVDLVRTASVKLSQERGHQFR